MHHKLFPSNKHCTTYVAPAIATSGSASNLLFTSFVKCWQCWFRLDLHWWVLGRLGRGGWTLFVQGGQGSRNGHAMAQPVVWWQALLLVKHLATLAARQKLGDNWLHVAIRRSHANKRSLWNPMNNFGVHMHLPRIFKFLVAYIAWHHSSTFVAVHMDFKFFHIFKPLFTVLATKRQPSIMHYLQVVQEIHLLIKGLLAHPTAILESMVRKMP